MKNILSLFLLLAFFNKSFTQGSNTCISLNNGSFQQYVTADNILNNFSFNKLTVTTWVKPTASNDHGGAIFAFNELSGEPTNNVNLVYFRSDHFEYFDRNPSNFNISTDGFFPPGNWYHVALVIDQNLNGKIYVNGVQRLTFNAEEVPVAGDRFSIGQEWDGYDVSALFQGEVDEMRIWNAALTVQQIREEMCKTISANATGLVAYYDFDDTGSVNSLTDISPNAKNGTLMNVNASDFVLSGAPIGNESVFVYPNSWTNQTLQLAAGADKFLQISNVSNNPEGIHIYHVQSAPNTLQGIDIQVVDDYFGVFGTNLNAKFTVEYGYGGYGFSCIECNKLPDIFARNDNADPNWEEIQAQLQSSDCTATKSDESGHGLSAREEYIIGKKHVEGNLALFPESVKACINDLKILDVSQWGGESFLWSDGSDSSILTTSLNGLFWVEITFPDGCMARDSVLLSDITAPVPFTIIADTLNCFGDTVVLFAPYQNDVDFSWSDGSSADSLQVWESSTVSLTYQNQCGMASDEVFIDFEDCFQLHVPNSFSPNSDGINDYFNIAVKNNRSLLIKRMLIFDRWGEKVFEKSNFKSDENKAGWDGDFKGKPAMSDIYIYLIDVAKPGGQTERFAGDLTLLR